MEKHDYSLIALVLFGSLLSVLVFTDLSRTDNMLGQVTNPYTSSIISSATCIDTDYGMNIFVQGKTYVVNKSIVYTDYCIQNSNALVEYSCGYGVVISRNYNCSIYGCFNGGCLRSKPRCGDGLINTQYEQCDNKNLNGKTCASLGYSSGTLSCVPSGMQNQCRFNTTKCVRVACTDYDRDGYGLGCTNGPDCNDSNPNINPGKAEICGNSIDENCNLIAEICANMPPIVSITYPASGASFVNGSTIIVNVSASDPNGSISKLEFYRNNVLVSTDVTYPYSYMWTNAVVGVYRLYARAYDNMYLSKNSTIITINVAVASACISGQTRPCQTGLLDVCANGSQVCNNNAWSTCMGPSPQPEICGNNIDENCNGVAETCQNTTGNKWYVSTTSSGTSSGNSWANKVSLSSFSWNNVQPGDTVYIDGGSNGLTYTTNLVPAKSGTSGSPITITRGVDVGHNGTPTFTTSSYRSGLFSSNYLVIQYLNFTSTGGNGFEVVEIDGNYVTFQYNTVFNPRLKAVRLDSGIGIKILHNTFDTGTSNPSDAAPDGMWIGNNGRNLEVAYNKILIRNSDPNNGQHKDVIQSYGWQADATGGTTKIHHNFFYNAEPTATSNTILELGGIGGNWQIYDNILVYGGQGVGRAIGMANCGEAPYDNYNFNAEIYNNILYIVNSEYYGTMIDNTNSLTFKNNIIYNPGGPYHMLGLGSVTTAHTLNIDYNQYTKASTEGFLYNFVCNGNANSYSWSQWRSNFVQDVHSEFFSGAGISFVGTSFPSLNPADYALKNTSSGVNEGTTITLVTNDYSGVSRPQGPAYDIGAYER